MSHSPPLVSVIVVVRNEAKYISQTIESILNQDYPNVEVHVQDGGSTDGTLEILKSYPIKWISEPDSGMANAANKAASYVSGEYLIFEGGDDLLKPNAITLMVEAFEKNPHVGYVYGDIDIIDSEGIPYSILRGKPFDMDELFIYNYIPSQSVLLKRSAFEGIGRFDENLILADWDLRIKMGAVSQSAYIPHFLASYRIHDNSTTLKNLTTVAKELAEISHTLLKDPKIRAALKRSPGRALAGAYITSALSYIRANKPGTAFKLYFKAFFNFPLMAFKKQSVLLLLGLVLGQNRFNQFIERRRIVPSSKSVRTLGRFLDFIKRRKVELPSNK